MYSETRVKLGWSSQNFLRTTYAYSYRALQQEWL
jgi:hypothetical protein